MKFLMPFGVLVAVGRSFGWSPSASAFRADMTFVIDVINQPFSKPELAAASLVPHSFRTAVLPLVLLAIWLFGSAMHLLAWWVRWRRVAVVVRGASPLEDRRELDALRRLEGKVG